MARHRGLLIIGIVVLLLGLAPALPAAAATPVDAVNDSVGYAADRSVNALISVVDRGSGAVLAQTGNANTQVASESIMKLFLASYYLVLYGGYQSTPDSVKDRLSFMLRYSDDDTASALFSSSAIPTIAGRYGLANTTNAIDRVGHWGAARITAGDMTTFLFRASQDAAVGPWLLPVMAQTAPTGSGADSGFSQFFGLNTLGGDHGSKQGWGCDSYWTTPRCAVHSVGYTASSFVAVLQLSNGYPDPMRDTATHAAQVIAQATKPDPVGVLDTLTNPMQNVLSISGWAADPAALGQREEVHAYVYGPSGSARYPGILTGGSRPDVAAVYPALGASTGFSALLWAQGEGVNMVCAYAINVSPPNTNPGIGCRLVQVRNAFGYLDSVDVRPGQMVANGWALNPNNHAEHVEIHVYDIGPTATHRYTGFLAGDSRPEIGSYFPDYGSDHSYSTVIPTTEAGTHTVCTFAITTGGGAGNPMLGCRTVQVRDAFGYYDRVDARTNTIVASGWALNPNNPAEQVEIQVVDTSASGTRRYTGFRAGTSRPDVGAAYPGYGDNHGYAAEFPSAEAGVHTVCVYAVTTGGGVSNPGLGCRLVTAQR